MKWWWVGTLLASLPLTVLAQRGAVLRDNVPSDGTFQGRRNPAGTIFAPVPMPPSDQSNPAPLDDSVTARPLPPPDQDMQQDDPADTSQQMVPNPLDDQNTAPVAGPSGQGRPDGQPQRGNWLQMGTATLQALDKVNARSNLLVVKVGDTGHFGSLDIAVRGCYVRGADRPSDATAFLVIRDQHADAPSFTGWMVRSAPYMSMLAHPIYDIRVAGCSP